MVSWLLKTPYGDVECHKSQSFGKPVWKKPDSAKDFGVSYFSDAGHSLERDVYVHVKNKWIPRMGNDEYAKRVYYKQWVEAGKPKKIDGKKVGIVVKKIAPPKSAKLSDQMTLTWNAKTKKKLSEIHLHRFVSKKMKYIIPEANSVEIYRKVVNAMKQENVVLLAKDIQLTRTTTVLYNYGIIVIGNHLVYVEVVNEDLQKPFPPDAMIPSDAPQEIGDVEEEDTEAII